MNLRQLLRKPFITVPEAKPVDLSGKHFVVTGASLGSLGYATAKQLSRFGATVIVTTRRNTEDVVAALKAELNEGACNGQVSGHSLELSNVASVNVFSRWYQDSYGERLDGLINNAGIHLDLMSEWKAPKLSADGVEIHWRTNYLGTVQLTHNLLALLRDTGRHYGEARVVNVVSQLHSRGSNELLFNEKRRYESWRAYGLSKLALIHFTTELHRRFADSDNLKSFCLHPGGKSGTYTNVADKGLEGHAMIGLLRKLCAPIERLFMATADEGAQTQLNCATSDEVISGHYYVNCQLAESSADSKDQNAACRLWESTEEWLANIPA